jgi:hypothetical protein
MNRLLFYPAMVAIVGLTAMLAANAADDGKAGAAAGRLISGEMACVSDWQKYCSQYGVDHDAIHACFVAHRDKVSPACMEVVRRYRSDK